MFNKFVDYVMQFDRDNSPEIENKIRQDFGIILIISGVFPSLKREHVKWVILHTLYVNIMLWYHIVLGIYSTTLVFGDLSLTSLFVHYSTIMICLSTAHLLSFPLRKYLCRLYKGICSNIATNNEHIDDEDFIKAKNKIIKKKKYCFILVTIVLISNLAIITIIAPILDQGIINIGKNPIITGPGWATKMPVIFWYPYNTDEGFMYYFTMITQITASANSTATMVSYVTIVLKLTESTCIHLKSLCHSINSIDNRTVEKYRQLYGSYKNIYKGNDRYNWCYFLCLRENIIHQQWIYYCFDQFQAFGSKLFTILSTSSVLLIGLSMCELASGHKQLGANLSAVMEASTELMSLFVLCYFGEQIITQSLELRDAIYSIKWYEQKNPYKKHMIPIMLLRTNRPLMLNCSIAGASIETFGMVLHYGYSCFSLFNVSRRFKH